MKLTKEQRVILKQKFDGNCSYCGEELGERWDADHFIPIKRNWTYIKGKQVFTDCENPENDNLDNMMPSCKSCNNDKSSLSIEDWRKMIRNKVICLNRDNTTYQKAKRYGLVKETKNDVTFYYEKCGWSYV